MTDTSRRSWLSYIVVILLAAAATAGSMYLWQNINDRRSEAKQHVFEIVPISEDVIDPAQWGKNYPRQYDGYRRTVDVERTRYGGSEDFQKLDEDPEWRKFFAGYAFAIDYREERGHAYMLADQENTERVKQVKQYGACLHCHAAMLPAYRHLGRAAGVPDDKAEEQIQKGFEEVCAMPYAEAHDLADKDGNKLVKHPVTCSDCHDPASMELRVTRPGFLNGIRALAESDKPLPHLPSIERWRKTDRKLAYRPNVDATRQEMRSLVCGQCHVEYYFKGDKKTVTYPWANGLKADEIELHYGPHPGELEFTDWKHKITGAPMLKAQHPEFETWSQGIHARSGVSCADCHMPYQREGAIKISDHHVRSPVLNISRACQTCHRYPEEEILSRVSAIQDRTKGLLSRAEDALADMIGDFEKAQQQGVEEDRLEYVRNLHRRAQWRLDFVSAENSMGFHAPQETARLLGEAIDLARQGQAEAIRCQAGFDKIKTPYDDNKKVTPYDPELPESKKKKQE